MLNVYMYKCHFVLFRSRASCNRQDFVSCVALECCCSLPTTSEWSELYKSVAVARPSPELLTALHGPLGARSLRACALVLASEQHRNQVVKRQPKRSFLQDNDICLKLLDIYIIPYKYYYRHIYIYI